MLNSQIINNFLVIGVFILIMALLIFIGKKILTVLINLVEKCSNKLANIIVRKVKSRYLLPILDIIFFILIGTFIFIYIIVDIRTKIFVQVAFLIYVFFHSMTYGSIVSYKKNNGIEYISLLFNLRNWVKKIKEKYIMKKYMLKRLIDILSQFFSMDTLFLLVSILVTYTIIIELKWPDYAYYSMYLILPVYVNGWIYFTFKLGLKNKSDINIRRIIVYTLLVAATVFYNYLEFKSYMRIDPLAKQDTTVHLINISSVIFIAIERLLKAWTDDYKDFQSN